MKTSGIRYNTDRAAFMIFEKLRGDARSSLGQDRYEGMYNALTLSPISFRDYTLKEVGMVDPYVFKWDHQMNSLLKKYRFENDKYTDDELEQNTTKSYIDFQNSLSWSPYKSGTKLILKEARRIMSSILGDYNPDEIVPHLQFGRKSSIGCSLANAYIDYKLCQPKAFTSSSLIAQWFETTVLPVDPHLRSIVRRLKRKGYPPSYARIDHLNLVNVPKSWKTLRSITPLTLLGLYYTYGIGGVLVERLRSAGLDLSVLQFRHRELAKTYSRSLTHVTADLSRASDSLTKRILMHILPRKWWNAIRIALTHKIKIQGSNSVFYTESVLPMGNGFTFPLETLAFFCLIKAVGHTMNVKGTYSVYGDDLIYPRRIHSGVVALFEQLKLTMNKDKTYVRYPFRESCGGDYYRGIDVRPFIVPDRYQLLTKTRYLAFLYKCANGLKRRWSEDEIPQTFAWITNEIGMISNVIHYVPPSFPDFSGIRCDLSELYRYNHKLTFGFSNGSRRYRFPYLRSVPKDRFVVDESVYYWLKLSRGHDFIIDRDYQDNAYPPEEVSQVFYLRYKKDKSQKWTCVSYVHEKLNTSFKHQIGSVVDWV